jgi:hypothetical protein
MANREPSGGEPLQRLSGSALRPANQQAGGPLNALTLWHGLELNLAGERVGG